MTLPPIAAARLAYAATEGDAMPIKQRRAKVRPFRISPEAAARWRKVGPGAIDNVCILDDELAELLGLDSLLAMHNADLMALRDALDAAGGSHAP